MAKQPENSIFVYRNKLRLVYLKPSDQQVMIPQSYFESKLSPYAQRLWWCISTDNGDMVDLTQRNVVNGAFLSQRISIIAYETTSLYPSVYTKYLTLIKRFDKPVSCLQVGDDIICKLYSGKHQDFRIWHPSPIEIRKCTINDDSFPEGCRNKLWSLESGIFSLL
jgi:hypothetical protein